MRQPARVPPDRVLQQMIMGFRTTLLLHAAAKLGIPDRLAEGPRSAGELAHACDCQPDALYRTLRALSNLGIVSEGSQQRFQLTALGQCLRTDVSGSLRAMAALYGEPWLWNAYGNMLHSVQTGDSAFEQVHGASFFDFLASDDEAAAAFHAAMSSLAEQEIDAIVDSYDFSDVRRVVDVGGGHGQLLAALLAREPTLRGTLFDRPAVLDAAREALERAEVDARCELIAGDFFEAAPEGGDLYVLKGVVHDWDDERASKLLQNVLLAMARDARVLVIERVVGEPGELSEAKLFDIHTMTLLGGRQRTQSEHQALLNSADLRLTRMIATGGPLTILEAMARR